MINNRTLRGNLTPDNVFEAICAAFSKEPPECKKWQEEEGIPMPEYQTAGVNARTLLIIMVVLIIFNVGIILLYRKVLQRELRRDMKTQVSSAVSQYIALSQHPELETK